MGTLDLLKLFFDRVGKYQDQIARLGYFERPARRFLLVGYNLDPIGDERASMYSIGVV